MIPMSKMYKCGGCGKESLNKEDIPTYKMFVCDSYDGDEIDICVDCEKKIKAHYTRT